jgi:hypothetical protein
MSDNKKLETYLDGKIGYNFLRISAERFASDLNEFIKNKNEFSEEQLFGIVAFSDHIKNQLEIFNKELASRIDRQK